MVANIYVLRLPIEPRGNSFFLVGAECVDNKGSILIHNPKLSFNIIIPLFDAGIDEEFNLFSRSDAPSPKLRFLFGNRLR